jgi:L-asparaginase
VATGNSRAHVAVFTLGGTIAMTDAGSGATPRLSARELFAAVPGLDQTGAALQVQEYRRVPGASLSYADVLSLAREIDVLSLAREITATGVDGVVVTQGTDTIEETSWLLDLLHAGQAPVVVTGAMRNASQAGSDGPANILAAVRVAASPQARGLGCVVVFGDQIHAARWVRKTHSTSPTAFTSFPGSIGYLAEERVVVWNRPDRLPRIAPEQATRAVRTAVATLGLGDDGTVLEAIGATVDGLVVAGFGIGHVPAACLDALTALAIRMPVVLASRTGSGPVLTETYGFPGSESDLLGRGLIPAGWLDPVKARVLLNLLLMTAATPDAITRRFAALADPTQPDQL